MRKLIAGSIFVFTINLSMACEQYLKPSESWLERRIENKEFKYPSTSCLKQLSNIAASLIKSNESLITTYDGQDAEKTAAVVEGAARSLVEAVFQFLPANEATLALLKWEIDQIDSKKISPDRFKSFNRAIYVMLSQVVGTSPQGEVLSTGTQRRLSRKPNYEKVKPLLKKLGFFGKSVAEELAGEKDH